MQFEWVFQEVKWWIICISVCSFCFPLDLSCCMQFLFSSRRDFYWNLYLHMVQFWQEKKVNVAYVSHFQCQNQCHWQVQHSIHVRVSTCFNSHLCFLLNVIIAVRKKTLWQMTEVYRQLPSEWRNYHLTSSVDQATSLSPRAAVQWRSFLLICMAFKGMRTTLEGMLKATIFVCV